MPDIRKPLIRAVTDNIQIRSKEVLTTSYGFGKVFAGITLTDNIDLDNYITPGVARLSANYSHGPSITNQPAFIIVYAVNQDEEREKPTNAKVQVAADSEEKPDTSSWKGRERYRQIYYPDSGSDNTPYTRTGTRDKDESTSGSSNGGNKITWGSWTSIAGSKIDQQLSSHEGRITILEMNTMMFSRHDFNTAGWKDVTPKKSKVSSATQLSTIPNELDSTANSPLVQLTEVNGAITSPSENGTVSSGHITAIEDSNKTYEYTFVTNHFTHTHVYEFETNNSTSAEQAAAASSGNNAANSSNATGSHCVDSEVEVHILGSTETEDIQREIKIVSHKTFNGYIITLGAITPPEFNGRIIKANTPETIISNLITYPSSDGENDVPDNGWRDEHGNGQDTKKEDGTAVAASSADKTAIKWSWTEDVVCITGIKRNPSNVSAIYIPSVLEIDGKVYPVKVIGSRCLSGNPWVTRVIIGEGIEVIYDRPFYNCTRLTRVDYPSTLKFLSYAQFQATDIHSVTLNQGLEYLTAGWLHDCDIHGTIKIPASLKKWALVPLAGGTFGSNFDGYEVDPSNQNFKTLSGALYSYDLKVLYDIPHKDGWCDNIYITPRSVKTIATAAFYRCDQLKSIIITSNVKYISWALGLSSSLVMLYIGSGIVPEKSSDTSTEEDSDSGPIPPTIICTSAGLGGPHLKDIVVSKNSKVFETEKNFLYNKGKKRLIAVPKFQNTFLFKLPDNTKIICRNAMVNWNVGILNLNNVETLENLAINNIGIPGGYSKSDKAVSTVISEDNNNGLGMSIYGLSIRFPDTLKTIQPQGLSRLFFASAHLFNFSGTSKYEIDNGFMFEKNNDPAGSTPQAQTDSSDGSLHNGHHRKLIAWFYPHAKVDSDDSGVEVKVPADVNAMNQGVFAEWNCKAIKTLDFSACQSLTVIPYWGCCSSNSKFSVKFPPKLERINATESIYILHNPDATLDFPATLYSINDTAILANCKQITFRCPKKNGEKLDDEGSNHTVTVNNIFGQINSSCIIRGIKGSYAEEVAARYTLKFQPVTKEELEKEDEEVKKKLSAQTSSK